MSPAPSSPASALPPVTASLAEKDRDAGLTPQVIGVFDSGVGGLSVLRALHRQMPQARYLYVADSGHAPYGERSNEFIAERTLRVATYLQAQGAGMFVLACNTATAVAAASLRQHWPAMPIVAVEPGIKPAVARTRNGRIGVMATPATLRSDKFRHLLDAHGSAVEVHLQPCPGLAGMIEQADPDDAALLALIEGFCEPLRAAGVDTVVLGCTHYPFVAPQIQVALGNGIELIDTAEAVARQAARLWKDTPADAETHIVPLQTTGDVERLRLLASRWLPFDVDVSVAEGL